jgi:hypothetical protein
MSLILEVFVAKEGHKLHFSHNPSGSNPMGSAKGIWEARLSVHLAQSTRHTGVHQRSHGLTNASVVVHNPAETRKSCCRKSSDSCGINHHCNMLRYTMPIIVLSVKKNGP